MNLWNMCFLFSILVLTLSNLFRVQHNFSLICYTEQRDRSIEANRMEKVSPTPPVNSIVWSADWLKNLLIFLIVSGLLITITIGLTSLGNVKEIAENWPRYRCNPSIMPFASFFGKNASENFNFCMDSIFRGKAATVFAPIYTVLGGFVTILTTISSAMNSIRYSMDMLTTGLNNFASSVRNRIQATLLQVRMTFMRLQLLMGRVFSVMYSVVWMGTSAITSGLNLGRQWFSQFPLWILFWWKYTCCSWK